LQTPALQARSFVHAFPLPPARGRSLISSSTLLPTSHFLLSWPCSASSGPLRHFSFVALSLLLPRLTFSLLLIPIHLPHLPSTMAETEAEKYEVLTKIGMLSRPSSALMHSADTSQVKVRSASSERSAERMTALYVPCPTTTSSFIPRC